MDPKRAQRQRRRPPAPGDLLDVHDAAAGRSGMRQAVGAGVRWMGPTQVTMQVLRVLTTLVLTRLLEPEEFGIVALATVVTGFFERVLGDTGTTTAVVRQPRLSQGLASSVLYWNMAVGLTTTAFFALGGGLIADVLGDPSAADLVRVLGALALVNSMAYVPRALFRRRLQFQRLATINMANAVVTSATTIAFAFAGYGAWSLVLGTMSGAVAALILSWLLSDWRPSLFFSRRELSEISGFSANLSAQNLFGYLSFAGDRFIIGRFIGTTQLGYYSLANRLMRYPVQTAAQTYREVVFPNLARIQDDFASMAEAYRRSVTGIAFVLFPACATVAAVSTPLVSVALGAAWEPAASLLALVAVTSALQAVAITTGSLYNARGRADLSLRWQVFSSIVLVGSYTLGAQWGVNGVAWGYLLGTLALTYPAFAIPLSLIGARTTYVLRGAMVTALVAGASALAGFGVLRLVAAQGGGDLVQVICGGGTSLGLYAAWALAFRPQVVRDLLSTVGPGRSGDVAAVPPGGDPAGTAARTRPRDRACPDLVLVGGIVLPMGGVDPVPGAGIAVADGRIVDVGPHVGRRGAATVVDASGCAVLPGLVDAHTHLVLSSLQLPAGGGGAGHRGIGGVERALDAEAARSLARLGAARSLLCGTTTVAGHDFQADAVAQAVRELGMRGVIGHTVRGGPHGSDGRRRLDDALRFVDRWDGCDPLVRPALAPYALHFVDPEWLAEMTAVAVDRSLVVHVHLAYTAQEVDQVRAATGHSPIEHAETVGLLDTWLIAAHCTHATTDDMARVQAHPSVTPVVCPTVDDRGNRWLRTGDLLAEGLRLTLGTDARPTQQASVIHEAGRVCGPTQDDRSRGRPISPRQALEMATADAAAALGIGDTVGRVAPGFAADLTVVRLGDADASDPYAAVVGAGDGAVERVYVAGRCVVDRTGLLTADGAEVATTGRRVAQRVRSAAGLLST